MIVCRLEGAAHHPNMFNSPLELVQNMFNMVGAVMTPRATFRG
jgi:hypothetical protein